jgi:thioredoxin-related protein
VSKFYAATLRYLQNKNFMRPLLLLFAELLIATIGALRTTPPDDPAITPKKEIKHEVKHINWLTIEEAYKLTQKKPKKFVIDVYTDWCGWCKVMDRQTFSKPAIVDYVNENFYAVRLNAEQTAPITLGQHTFKYVGSGGRGVHELAAALMKNQMSYPTTVFMDEKFNLIQPVPGYMEPRMFHQIITYFGGNNHQKEPFDQFKTGTYAKAYQTSLAAGK